VTLRGHLEAFANAARCQRSQTVRIQRRRPNSVTFSTIATRRTAASGTFSMTTRPTATYVYRARVSESAECNGAVSNRERVAVSRRR
jgi:hypothetical protein